MGFPQRVLAEDEALVLVLRRHVKVLFVPLLVFVSVVAVAVLLAVLVPEGSAQPWLRLTVSVIAGLILARWVLWPFLVWRYTIHAITTRRLILRSGVFNRQGHDMPLTRLNDVSFQHNFAERLLGCGTLVVESAGERGQLVLSDIPKVELVQRTLYRLADDLRGHRGPDSVDPELAQTLDDAFDSEFADPRTTSPTPHEGSPEPRTRSLEPRTRPLEHGTSPPDPRPGPPDGRGDADR